MASSLKLVDFQEPLVIDIGSDKVKFAQPIMNTHHITNASKKTLEPLIKERKKIYKRKSRITEIEFEEYGINQNSIYDTEIFMESFPTILGKISKDQHIEIFKRYINQYNSGDISEILSLPEYAECLTSKYSFLQNNYVNLYGYEPVYAGVIQQDQFQIWENIIERIGEIRLNKSNFLSYYFAETPLIITQKALPFNKIKTQLKTIYELAFEVYKTPYLLICSSAILNLYSHNLTSGIVVDIGDSSTNITAVVDCFTKYESAIDMSFMSGRNITSFMAMFDNISNDGLKIGNQLTQQVKDSNLNFNSNANFLSSDQIPLEQYLKIKFLKEKNNLKYTFQADDHNVGDKNLKEIYMGNLFLYPELFKYIFSNKRICKNKNNKDDDDHHKVKLRSKNDLIKDINELIIYTNNLYNNINYFGEISNSDFYNDYIFPYLNEENSLENKILSNETNFTNKNQLNCFKQLSLPHLILYEIEKMINSDILNVDKYLNIVFTGGVFNLPSFRNYIETEFKQLIQNCNFDNKKFIKLYFPDKYSDSSNSIAKGMNYLSKIDDLDELMISISDYHNLGKECLCYNYI